MIFYRKMAILIRLPRFFYKKVLIYLHISVFFTTFAVGFEKCGVSTSVVHRLPKPRRRVRFPYTALSRRQKDCETKESRSVYRCGGKEKHMCFNLISRGKSGQHRAPQRLTAVRQQCLVPATETRRVSATNAE